MRTSTHYKSNIMRQKGYAAWTSLTLSLSSCAFARKLPAAPLTRASIRPYVFTTNATAASALSLDLTRMSRPFEEQKNRCPVIRPHALNAAQLPPTILHGLDSRSAFLIIIAQLKNLMSIAFILSIPPRLQQPLNLRARKRADISRLCKRVTALKSVHSAACVHPGNGIQRSTLFGRIKDVPARGRNTFLSE